MVRWKEANDRVCFTWLDADLKAGKYRTIADAMFAAGLKMKRTRLHQMKNAWAKASRAEQREFLNWLREVIKAELRLSLQVHQR